MKAAGLQEIKKELQQLAERDLVELCLSLARYKKDNKEYVSYLLFDAHDKPAFVKEIKSEVDLLFQEMNAGINLYYAKKGLRKILRFINKYCKYIGDKAVAAELHIYFCMKLKESGIPVRRSQQLVNLYEQELKKISALVSTIHEDLQVDFQDDLQKISSRP